jgi:glycosyltransferase involved in cell wall biosynthesis
MKYSLVIPTYNERESLDELYTQLISVMNTVAPNDYEILFINDGSTDGTLEKIKELQKKDGAVHQVSFRVNQGKSAGLAIGFNRSKGDYVITMDADLQDEPKEIPKLIKKMNEGYDMVSGWKENRQDPLNKTLPSKVFNFVVSKFSGVPFHDFNCGFKIYKKEVVKEIKIYGQLYRFIPVLVALRGFKITELKVKHNKRKYGVSKYTWKRIFPGLMDFITVMFLSKFGKRPLHLFGTIGGTFVGVSFILFIYLAVLHFSGTSVGDKPLLTVADLLFISGLQIIFTGLIAEMLTEKSFDISSYPILEEN